MPTDLVALMRHIITRRRIPPGQITLYKALYEAGPSGMTLSELADYIRDRDVPSMRSVLGPLARRINNTPHPLTEDHPGLTLFFTTHDDPTRYSMTPELRTALESIPLLISAISLPVDDIFRNYATEKDYLLIEAEEES